MHLSRPLGKTLLDKELNVFIKDRTIPNTIKTNCKISFLSLLHHRRDLSLMNWKDFRVFLVGDFFFFFFFLGRDASFYGNSGSGSWLQLRWGPAVVIEIREVCWAVYLLCYTPVIKAGTDWWLVLTKWGEKSDAGTWEGWAGKAVLWAQKSCFSNTSHWKVPECLASGI